MFVLPRLRYLQALPWILAPMLVACAARVDGSKTSGLTLQSHVHAYNPDSDFTSGISQNRQRKTCINGDNYQLMLFPKKNLIEVKASLRFHDTSRVICLPAFGQRFGETFALRNVRDASGQVLEVPFDSSGCANLHAHIERLDIGYALEIAPIDDYHVWLANSLSPTAFPKFIAFPGEALFIEHGDDASHCTHVEVMHDGVGKTAIFSTLEQMKSDTSLHTDFFAPLPFDLTRAFFVFGDLTTYQASGASDVRLLLTKDMDTYASIIMKDVLSIIEFYQKWMPQKWPARVSIFVFQNRFDVHHASGFARPEGIVLQFGREALLNSTQRRLLIAHELFHLFNGEQFHFDRKAYARMSWFIEGMTQYLALNAVRTLGLIHENHYRTLLADMVTRMADIEKLPPDERMKIQNKPYLDGFFLSWMIEQQWRKHGTRTTLEGFWSHLAQTTDWKQPKTIDWLKNQLELYSSFNFDAFFSLYVYGNAVIPYQKILMQGGYCIQPYQLQKYDSGFQWIFDPTASAYQMISVAPGSPAESVGLRAGSYFVPREHTNWKTSEDKYIRRMTDDGRMQSFRLPTVPVLRDAWDVVRCRP